MAKKNLGDFSTLLGKAGGSAPASPPVVQAPPPPPPSFPVAEPQPVAELPAVGPVPVSSRRKEPAAARPKGRPRVELGATETRVTVITTEEVMEKIRRIGYWERLLVKEVMTKALSEYVRAYEAQYGLVKPIPQRGLEK